MGADAVDDLVPLRPLSIGGGVRRIGRGCDARTQAAATGITAAVVAFSRVYTGVHYPGDVVAGAMVGALVGWTTSAVARRLRPDPSRPRLRRSGEPS